jgi:flagellar motor switch protein FliN
MSDDLPNNQRAREHYVDPATAGVAGPHFAPLSGAAPRTGQGHSAEPPRGDAVAGQASPNFDRLGDIELDLKIVLGRAEMELAEVLKLDSGSVVMLDALADDLVDIVVNGRLIARGEVVVVDGNFCVRVVELMAGRAAA